MMKFFLPSQFFRKAQFLNLSSIERIFPYFLLLLYFLTSSGELLHVLVFIFKPKIAHVIGVAAFAYYFLRFRKVILPRPILFAFLWILLSQIASVFFSPHPLRSCGYIGVYLFNFIFYFLLPVNFFQFFSPSKILKTYSLAFCCIGLYATAQVLCSVFGFYDPFAGQRVAGTIARGQAWTYEPSYYALYMTAFVMFKNGLTIFQFERIRSWKRALKLFGINLLLVMSTSTGLVFSYPIFCIVSLWASLLRPLRQGVAYVKWRIIKFITLCSGTLALLSWFFWDAMKESFFKFFNLGFLNHWSFTTRLEGIFSAFNVFLEHPIFGVGIGGVGPYLFMKNSHYDVFPETLPEVEIYDPTNALSELLASLGIIGFVGFIILAWAFYSSFKYVIKNPDIAQSDKITAVALFISLIVLLIVLQFNQGLFRPYIWIHASIVYGYLCSFRKEHLRYSP